MKSGGCTRAWEAEAARDGRLSADALASYRVHASACRDCRHEVAGLQALGEALRDAEPPADEVSLRRVRANTLARAFELLHARPAPRARALWACALGATVLAAVMVVDPLLLRNAPSIVVTPHGDASWKRLRARDADRVELGDGVLSLVVHRRLHDRRVIVRVPDGEIEDYGTAFEVRVTAGRTVRISVSEGGVVFRRRGAAQVRLTGGMTWSADAVANPAPVVETANGDSKVAHDADPVRPQPAPKDSGSAPALRGGAPVLAERARAHVHHASVSTETAQAAEDAAYLRVLALLREGRGEEARLAATAYLDAFPNGFRRVEVQRIAQPPAPRVGARP